MSVDEVLAISDKVVLKAEDLLSWLSHGASWECGLKAVWRGACAPPAAAVPTQPLHHTRLDFSDVDKEKNQLPSEPDIPGVVVFSYPRYCRYRALAARLEGIKEAWLRDALVAALGGYAADTKNTVILYCRDTFEYPELESHEFICNHLAPRLKGRPRGRRRRAARSRSQSPSSRSRSRSSDSDRGEPVEHKELPKTPRRLSLRNGAPDRQSEGEEDEPSNTEDRAFLLQLKLFYKGRGESFSVTHALKD
ncbi:AT-rich interactive domain-containing protein 5B-like, partial [Hyposmocoma kahamanoa]|uniref:AT-rich interactive domain-containing protein 5B-like n=1 Tax=Hyposmocoma kahamanoa TaxID=1477025 RepID=UPI000E6D7859